jgi:hypothetical protein
VVVESVTQVKSNVLHVGGESEPWRQDLTVFFKGQTATRVGALNFVGISVG